MTVTAETTIATPSATGRNETIDRTTTLEHGAHRKLIEKLTRESVATNRSRPPLSRTGPTHRAPEIGRASARRHQSAAMALSIRSATPADVPVILAFIRDLAVYEKLLSEVEATEEKLRATLFPAAGRAAAECVLAFADEAPAGFAIFFHNYSTFLAKPGLYLEDLFV